MANLKKISVYLLVMIFSLAVIVYLYPKIHPYGGIRFGVNKEGIQTKAQLIREQIGIEPSQFIPHVNLEQQRNLIRHLQTEHGLQKANEVLRDKISGYYFAVRWHRKQRIVFEDGTGNGENDVQEWKTAKSLQLDFDTNGQLIGLKREIPDSIQFQTLTEREARKIALDFLNKHTSLGSNLKETSNPAISRTTNIRSYNVKLEVDQKAGVQPDTPFEAEIGGMGYEFNFKAPVDEINRNIGVKIAVIGNTISELSLEYNLPEPTEDILLVISKVLVFLVFLFLLILALVEGFKRLRSYEVGLKVAIVLGIVALVTSLFEYLTMFSMQAGWEVFLSLLLGPIFVGTGLLLSWAVSESVGRDLWRDKFITFDLIVSGYLGHSRIGKSILEGTALGLAAVAVFNLLVWTAARFFELSFVLEESGTLGIFSSNQAAVFILSHNVYVGFYILAVFVILFLSILRKHLKIIPVYLLGAVLIFSFFFSGNIRPIGISLLINMSAGIILLWSFYRKDVVSAYFAIFAFLVTRNGIGLFFSGLPEHYFSAVLVLAGLAGISIYAIVIQFTKDAQFDLTKIAPVFARYINERQRMQRELDIAREVQMGFLPHKMPDREGLDIAAQCLPALEVGGDYYDFINLGSDKLGVAIGDVSGKGTQAAFYMTLTKGFLQAVAQYALSPAEALKRMNRLFYENARRNTFISMVFGVFDLNKKILTLARAGHNPVIMQRRQNSGIQEIESSGLALGLDDGTKFDPIIEQITVDLQAGDLFVFYTDGLTEAMNDDLNEFGEEQLYDLINRNRELSAEDLLQEIHKQVQKFVGRARQHDDMSTIVIRIK